MLVEYQLGCLDEKDRQSVEEHLESCPACLREYFAGKRRIEDGGRPAFEGPSAALRMRIRQSVSQEFGAPEIKPQVSRMGWAFSARPMAFAGAAAAVLAVVWMTWPRSFVRQGVAVKTAEKTPEAMGGVAEDGWAERAEGRTFETDSSRGLTEVEGIL